MCARPTRDEWRYVEGGELRGRVVLSRKNLRIHIERAGWDGLSRQDLASRLVLSEPTLKKWLSEDGEPPSTNMSTLKPVAKRLGVEPYVLVEGYSSGKVPSDTDGVIAAVSAFSTVNLGALLADGFNLVRNKERLLHYSGVLGDSDLPINHPFGSRQQRSEQRVQDAYALLEVGDLTPGLEVVLSYQLRLAGYSIWADFGRILVEDEALSVTNHWWMERSWRVPLPANGRVPFLIWYDRVPDLFNLRAARDLGTVQLAGMYSLEEGERLIREAKLPGFERTWGHVAYASSEFDPTAPGQEDPRSL